MAVSSGAHRRRGVWRTAVGRHEAGPDTITGQSAKGLLLNECWGFDSSAGKPPDEPDRGRITGPEL